MLADHHEDVGFVAAVRAQARAERTTRVLLPTRANFGSPVSPCLGREYGEMRHTYSTQARRYRVPPAVSAELLRVALVV